MSISSDFLFHYTPSTTCQILWSSKSLPDPKCVKGYSNTTQTNLATLDAYLLHTFSLECITKWILEIFEYLTKLGGLLFCHYVCVYAHAAHGTDHNIQSLHYSSSQLWPLWNPLTFCLSLWNAVSMFMLPYEQCINQTQQYDSITMQYNAQKMQSTILCSIIALNISLTLKAYLILSSACLTFPRQLSNTSIVLLSPGKSSRDHSHSLIQLLETKMLINQYASVIIRRMLTGNHVAKFVWDMAVSDSIRCIFWQCTYSIYADIHFIFAPCHTLSWSISSDFSVLNSCNVSQPKIAQKFTKNLFCAFKVIDFGTTANTHEQCLLWEAASLCLSGTVLTLDELILIK